MIPIETIYWILTGLLFFTIGVIWDKKDLPNKIARFFFIGMTFMITLAVVIHFYERLWTMSVFAAIAIGSVQLFFGLTWSKKSWANVFYKYTFMALSIFATVLVFMKLGYIK